MGLLVVASIWLVATNAQAGVGVNPEMHQRCIEARDYEGCVRTMTGDGSTFLPGSGAQSLIIQANRCPSGYAYIGNAKCQEVKCEYGAYITSSRRGHDQLIAGKVDAKGNNIWKCTYNFWYGQGELRLAGSYGVTTDDVNCPEGPPEVGFNNTCQTMPVGWTGRITKLDDIDRNSLKCGMILRKYNCSYNSYLEANPAVKQWAELNPILAAKERKYLKSVD